MEELLFEYKVRIERNKDFTFYAKTDIEEFLNKNNIKYIRNITDTVEHRLLKENKRLNNIIDEIEQILSEKIEAVKYMKETLGENVYEAGTDFSMIVRSVGAFSTYHSRKNFRTDWNRPTAVVSEIFNC